MPVTTRKGAARPPEPPLRPPQSSPPCSTASQPGRRGMTPPKLSAGGPWSRSHEHDYLSPYLREDLNNATGVPLECWTSASFTLPEDSIVIWINEIANLGWFDDKMIRSSLAAYCSATEEEGRYKPFVQLTNRIVELARGTLTGVGGNYPVKDFCFAEYNRPVDTIEEHEGLGAVRKPDVLGLRKTMARKLEYKEGAQAQATVRWTDILLVLELKFKNEGLLTSLNSTRASRKLEEISPDGKPVKSAKKRKPAKKSSGLAATINGHHNSGQTGPPPQGNLLESLQKRGVYFSEGAADTSETAGIRAAAQTASYALEMLSCTYGTRQFCLGAILKDDAISLWHYDASGIVYSAEYVSIVKNFETFAAIIVGFANCTPEQFGAFPTSVLQPHIPYARQFPQRNLEEGTITMPHPHTREKINITLDQCLFTQYILIGRRTFLYTVDTDPVISKDKLIMKISYQVSTRRKEYELVDIAKKAKVRHLPEIHLWGDLWQLSDGVRDVFLQKSEHQAKYEDRVLRAIIYTRYSPVKPLFTENILLIPVMADQMIDCLSDLWYKANILHRDISVNNIMYEKRGDYYHFVLIDFDMAIELPGGDISSYVPSSKHRTGTLPFMAHELIGDAHEATRLKSRRWMPTRHVLYHDLQSIFWASIWSGLVLHRHTLNKEQQDELLGFLKEWENTNLNVLASFKSDHCYKFISDWRTPLPGPVKAIENWFDAWTIIFCDAMALQRKRFVELKRAKSDGQEAESFDEDTIGGIVSPQALKSALSPFVSFKQKAPTAAEQTDRDKVAGMEEALEMSVAKSKSLAVIEEKDEDTVHDTEEQPVEPSATKDRSHIAAEERSQDEVNSVEEAFEGRTTANKKAGEGADRTAGQATEPAAARGTIRTNAKNTGGGEIDEAARPVSEAPAAKRQTRATVKRKADRVDEPADRTSKRPAVKRKTRTPATKKAENGVNKTAHQASEAPAHKPVPQKPPPQRQTRKRARPQEQEVAAENDIRARLRPRRKIA